MSPVLLDQLAFVGGGIGLLFGLAIASHLLHPWWIVRRRRLKRLSAGTSPKLWEDLDQLSHEMSLSRSPDWRLAPFARTAGGQAFGLPWHRYVQLDAGLLALHATNRPAFRAVVLHELAHLRNRDVDKTYLTIGIWRAFAVVALFPYLALVVHPELFRTPFGWHWYDVALVADPGATVYRLGSLLVLTGVVYLTRNAILRVRETHADVTAAAHHGGQVGALRAALEWLPAPRHWWNRWGPHPHPRRRLDTVNNPRLLFTAGIWELVGVGIATGLICSNLGSLVGINLLNDAVLALAVVGFVASPVAVGLLAVAIWRATANDPVTAPSARTWLACPVALVAGFAGGSFLSLHSAATVRVDGNLVSPVAWVVSTLLLTVGSVLLAGWITSTARGVLMVPEPARWAMPAVVVVAAFVGAVLFAVWLPASLVETGFAVHRSQPPAVGADIGWYAWLATWTDVTLGPVHRLVFNPLTLPALMLCWLVPVLVTRRSRVRRPPGHQPIPLRGAFTAGIVGTACVTAIGVALPFATKAALPSRVRQPAEVDGVPFFAIYDAAGITIAAVTVAVVMAVVVARRGPHRPALAIMAGSLTAALSTLAIFFVTDPIACHVNVWDFSPAPTRCFGVVYAQSFSRVAHEILVQGVVLAIPIGLVAAVLGQAYRHRRPPIAAPPPPSPLGRLGQALTAAPLVLLVAFSIWLSLRVLPLAYQVWLEHALG
ncbi:M48 family metalloprotease [Micromonospora rubida]